MSDRVRLFDGDGHLAFELCTPNFDVPRGVAVWERKVFVLYHCGERDALTGERVVEYRRADVIYLPDLPNFGNVAK